MDTSKLLIDNVLGVCLFFVVVGVYFFLGGGHMSVETELRHHMSINGERKNKL